MFQLQTEKYSADLQRLIDNAYKGQWTPTEKINWHQHLVAPDNIPHSVYVDMVSQLYYAEEATIEILGRMIQEVPDLQAKQYLCTQAMDEARHAQVYRRYLEKLGDIAPINEALRTVLENGLMWKGTFCGTIIALNVVMEGEALNQQNKRIKTLPCPIFLQMNQAIIRDEARHAAFGKIYMKNKLSEIDYDEKQSILNWLSQLWKLWAKANTGRYNINGNDILKTDSKELQQRWMVQEHIFKKIGLH